MKSELESARMAPVHPNAGWSEGEGFMAAVSIRLLLAALALSGMGGLEGASLIRGGAEFLPHEANVTERIVPFSFFGLEQFVTGSARSSLGPAGELRVSNIGDSGEDGILVPLGEAAGFLAAIHPPDGRVAGAQLLWNISGMEGGVHAGRIASENGELHVYADSSASAAGGHLVEVFQGEVLAGSAVVPMDFPLFRAAPGFSEEAVTMVWHGPMPGQPFWRVEFLWPAPNRLLIEEEEGLQVWRDATLVRVSPVGVRRRVSPGPGWQIALSGVSLPLISIFDQALLFRAEGAREALAHRAKGGAMMKILENKILRLDIPADADTVLAIEAPREKRGMLLETEPFQLPLAGGELTLMAVGGVNGRAGSSLGSAGLRGDGRRLELKADFERAGSASAMVEVFHGNRQVGTATLNAGEGVIMSEADSAGLPALEALGFAPPALLPGHGGFDEMAREPAPSYYFGFAGPARFQIGRSLVLVGDRVRFLPETTGIKVQELELLNIAAGRPDGVPLVIRRERLRIAPPELEPVSNLVLSQGTMVEILGSGFGKEIKDLSIMVVDKNNPCEVVAPLKVLASSDTQVTARVELVMPGAQSGHLVARRGVGRSGTPIESSPEVKLLAPILTGMEFGPGNTSPDPLLLEVAPPDPGIIWFKSGPPAEGVLEVFLTGQWPSGTLARVIGKWFEESPGGALVEVEIPEFELLENATAFQCAGMIADLLLAVMEEQAGVEVVATAEEISPGEARLALALVDGQIECGILAVSLTIPPPGPPQLRIERGPDEVRVLWPLAASGWILEETSSLDGLPISWEEVPLPYDSNGTDLFTTIPAPAGQRFFRLRKELPSNILIP
jgi:hypothetical protein